MMARMERNTAWQQGARRRAWRWVAIGLTLVLPLAQAVAQARGYILGAIAAGADVSTGKGHGPLNHGYAPMAQRVL